MPRSRSWGGGRACLLAVPAGESGAGLARLVASAGLEPLVGTSEPEVQAALEREALAIVLASHRLGPAAISGLVTRAERRHPSVPVLVLGASGTVQEAVEAMQQGAADYLAPPFGEEALLARMQRLVEHAPATPGSSEFASPYAGLIGSSAAIRRVLSTIDKISRYKTNVLILGESGSGKELIARALHARGPRRRHLFVPLNCATLGRDLLESELFGHERGAFTGANERKRGLFELADGGTLFLDEIAEMDLSTQAKLLRVLERNAFRRVGGTGKVKVDLSVVAATHRDLEEAIRAGRFREDLYYRLKVVTLHVPPLRERREDIPTLIETFIADFNRRNDGKIRGISPHAVRQLMEHDWPGNVRELKNAVESAAVLASGDTIGADGFADLAGRRPAGAPPSRGAAPPQRPASAEGVLTIPIGTSLAQVERELIAATLARYGTKREAARVLGLGLRTLYTKLREYEGAPPPPGVSAKTA